MKYLSITKWKKNYNFLFQVSGLKLYWNLKQTKTYFRKIRILYQQKPIDICLIKLNENEHTGNH